MIGITLSFRFFRAPIAQWIEYPASNRVVGGSSPLRCDFFSREASPSFFASVLQGGLGRAYNLLSKKIVKLSIMELNREVGMTRKERIAAFQAEGYNMMVTGRHVLVTDSMKDYAMDKVSRIERFTDRILDVMITMDVQKLEHRADIVMQVNNLKIKSSAATSDMYVSVDQAVDKLEKQLLKYKRRLKDHQARGIKSIDMKVNVFQPHRTDDLDEVNDLIDEEAGKELVERFRPHDVVSRETKPLKTLSLDDAIMKMELSQDVFLIYRAEEDHKIKVIYRRSDGNYGVISVEP